MKNTVIASALAAWIASQNVLAEQTKYIDSNAFSSSSITPIVNQTEITKQKVKKVADFWDIKLAEASLDSNITPSANSLKAESVYSDYETFKATLWVIQEFNNSISNDTILEWNIKWLFMASEMGASISLKKGSNIQKIVATVVKDYEGGNIKLSVAQLKKVVSVSFDIVGKSFDTELTQNAIGLEYSYGSLGDLINDLSLNVTYFSVDDKNLGKIGEIVVDNSSEFDLNYIYWSINGSSTVRAWVNLDLKINDNMKWLVSANLSDSKVYWKVWAIYQSDDYNRVTWTYSFNGSSNIWNLEYQRDLWNGFNIITWVKYQDYLDDNIEDNTTFYAWFKATLWKTKSKLSSLFNKKSTWSKLNLNNLEHVSDTNTESIISWFEAEYSKDHIVYVDKTTTNSSVEYDNGTVTVKTDLWVSNLVNGTIDSSTHPDGGNYTSLFSIESNGILVAKNFETLPIWESRLSIEQTGGWYVLVSYLVEEGSNELKRAVITKKDVSEAERNAYLNGAKNIDDVVEDSNNPDTEAPLLSSTNQTYTTTEWTSLTLQTVTATDNADGTVTVVQSWDTVDFDTVWTYDVIYTATDSSWNSSSITHTYVVEEAPNPNPNQFTFTDKTNVSVETLTVSDTQTVSGLVGTSTLSISWTGEYQLNGWLWSTSPVTVSNGDTFVVRHISSSTSATSKDTTITIWTTTDTFSTTTIDSPELSSFTFVWTAPDIQNTVYTDLVIETDVDIKSITSLVSSNWGTISNVTKLADNRVQFDFTTPNSADTFLNLTAVATDNDETTASVRVLLPNTSNTAPTLDLDVTWVWWDFRWDVYNVWVDYTQYSSDSINIDVSWSTDDWTVDNLEITSDLRGSLHNSSVLNKQFDWDWLWSQIETLTITITDNWWFSTIETIKIAWD